ncbi:lamin tail domain-containing protein [Haladaptatus sp. DYF46]|uniref:lamin tail domain-containing protein n=1 Tax=Haladaptatus sp. DYF46 TaxID=2886041 RepID=UPI001E2F5495|nr:lamin tail domain-containing protein [Haladaptatus sp. DYF46]
MAISRRKMLGGLGVLALSGFGTTTVIGDSHRKNIEVQEVNPEGEYVVFVNNGDTDYDLSNYVVAFEYMNPEKDQRDALPERTVLKANSTLKVATGAKEVEGADVTFDNENHRLNDDGSDVVALLTPDPVEDPAICTGQANTGDQTTTTEEEVSTPEDETTTTDGDETTTTEEEDTTTESDSDESTSDETTDDSESSDNSSDDTQSDESESSGSDGSEESNSDNSSSEEDSQDDC